MKQRLNIILLLLLLTTTFRGQDDFGFSENEFLIYGGFGISALTYPVTIGERKNGFGGHFGLGYLFAMGESGSLGFVLGAEAMMSKSTYTLDELKTQSRTSVFGELLDFHSEIENYEEVQNVVLVQVPLMLQVQTASGLTDFYVGLGIKAGMPIVAKYKASAATVMNTGTDPFSNNEPFDTQEFAGLGTFTNQSREGDVSFGFAVSAAAEAGLKIMLVSMTLYIGLSLDYGLLNIRPAATDTPFIEYNAESPREFKINSITQSVYPQGSASRAFTEKIVPLSFGLKIKVGF